MDNRAIKLMKFNLEIEKSKMNKYAEEVRSFQAEYGYHQCDYVNYRREMELFHRGRVNLLMDLIKELGYSVLI